MSGASLIVAESKEDLPSHLTALIAALANQSIEQRGNFTLALSGGSLPSFLTSLKDAFGDKGAPQWDKWHILLADERCVPETDADSNLGSIREKFLASTEIPSSQIYGIDQEKLSNESTEAVAEDYEKRLQLALEMSGGYLDLAVLGFGPDGHTCSLFPNHPLLMESTKLVAAITDSPKPPPNRITLTFPVLNKYTRAVIICGAGASKGPILEKVVASILGSDGSYAIPKGNKYNVTIQRNPAPFPCAMVEPSVSLREGKEDDEPLSSPSSLTWIVDSQAMQNANLKLDSSM